MGAGSAVTILNTLTTSSLPPWRRHSYTRERSRSKSQVRRPPPAPVHCRVGGEAWLGTPETALDPPLSIVSHLPPSRVWHALRRPSLPLWRACAQARCFPHSSAPGISAASFRSPLEDTQHLLTQRGYTVEGVVLYGIESYYCRVFTTSLPRILWVLGALIPSVTTKTVFRHLLGHKPNPCCE